MPDQTQDYQRVIDTATHTIELVQGMWERILPEKLPTAYLDLGKQARRVGIGRLLLGDPQEARRWFRESAEYYRKSGMGKKDQVLGEQGLLESAVLTGDAAFWREAAEAAPDRLEKQRPHEAAYAMFLKYTILGEGPRAALQAKEAADLSPAVMKKRGGYGTLGAACLALDERDAAKFAAALQELLKEHAGKAKANLRNSAEGYVCIPATVLLMLARERGMDVTASSPFIPAALIG